MEQMCKNIMQGTPKQNDVVLYNSCLVVTAIYSGPDTIY